MSAIQFDGMMVGPSSNSVPKRSCENRHERRFHWQAALLLESVRRETFSNWQVPFINPDELAKIGFFYLRTQDHVQCVFCQGIVGYWDPGDKPEVEHRKHFPNCPFITGSTTGNVPRAGNDENSTALFNFLHEYHSFRVSSTKPQNADTSYQTDSIRVPDAGQLAYPHLNTISNRLQTFSRWPKDVGVEPDVLAEAGFFSTGLADWVQCFHCGGGLYNWRQGDDPLGDHGKFFPFCPFARGKLGEDTVNRKIKENPPPSSNPRAVKISDSEANLILHHPMAKRLIDMGLSSVSVKEALRNRLQKRGILCRTVTEALELVFDYEEQKRINSNSNNICHDGPMTPSEVVSLPSGQNQIMRSQPPPFHSNSTHQDNYNIQAHPEYKNLLNEVESLKQLVVIEEQRLICRMCKKSRVAVVFQPCSHLHLCAECARPRDSCPTCGSIVRGTLKPIIS